MLVFTKVKRINFTISKIWIYYVEYNNTKYYLIASYLLGKPTNNRTSQKILKKLDEVYKSTKSIRNQTN